MRALLGRIRDAFNRRALDRAFDDEIAAHLELAAADLQARGMDGQEANRVARTTFGGVSQVKEAEREARSFPRIETTGAVVRDAIRVLWTQPRFASVAVFTLALGIGATTAVYSVVNGVLLKPLPFPNPERLVSLYHVTPASATDFQGASSYFTYRDHGRVFEDIGLWQTANVAVSRAGVPEQVRVLRVTEGTLPLLGVRPELGRLIEKKDDAPGASSVAVLTHAYWQEAFGASRDVVGQSLLINGAPSEIIGVLPASFRFLNTKPQVVVPMRLDRATTRALPFNANGVGRLKPAVTAVEANGDIARMIPLITRQFPLPPGVTQDIWDAIHLAPNVRPLADAEIGDLRRPLWILLGTVVIVLLMAWTNVAHLLLVRAEARQQELAVRWALGASPRRIAASLLGESVVLGLAGGAAGVLLAQAGIELLRWLAPIALPRLTEIRVDTSVLLVTSGISVATSLVFGLVPVLRPRMLHASALKESGRANTDVPGRHRMRNTLIVGQIALAVVLLTVSGLMTRTFITLRQVQPGFARPTEVETFSVSLPPTLIRETTQVLQTFEQISARLRQVPSVSAVGLGMITMDGRAGKGPIFVEGVAAPTLPPIRSMWPVGPGYFEAMGMPIVAGRTLTWADLYQRSRVTLISENLAREYWETPAQAIGRRIRTFNDEPWQEIIGVVGNLRADGLNHPPPSLVYAPMAGDREVNRNMMYVVRSGRAGTAGLLRELQQAVWSVNGQVPLANVRTLAEMQADSMAQTTFATTMLIIAAGVALLLALVGVYSVVSHIVSERTNEVGIRMALGAQVADVRRMFLRHGLLLTLGGVALGVGMDMLLTPLMSALLYGVGPTDPMTYAAVSILLGVVTLAATYLPARRASRVQPIIALRSSS